MTSPLVIPKQTEFSDAKEPTGRIVRFERADAGGTLIPKYVKILGYSNLQSSQAGFFSQLTQVKILATRPIDPILVWVVRTANMAI